MVKIEGNALRRLARYLRPELPTLSTAYVCMITLAVANALYAALSGPAVQFIFSGNINNILLNTNGEIRAAWRWLPDSWLMAAAQLPREKAFLIVPLAIVATAVIKGLSQTGQFFLLGRVSQRILLRVRNDAFNSLLRLSPAFYDRRAHGDLVSRLTHDANVVEQAVFYGYSPLLRDTLSVGFLLAYCFITDAKLSLLTFITVPLAILPLSRFAAWLKKVSQRGQAAQGDINAVSYESLAGHRVVQAFGMEAHEGERLHRAGLRYYHEMMRSYFIRAIRTPVMEILGACALAGLLAFLGYKVQTQGGDPAHYLSFFFAILMMYDPLKQLGRVTDYLAAGSAAAERIFEIIDIEPDIKDKPNAKPLLPFKDKIHFDQVAFTYGDAAVLRSVDLEIKAGDLVALVGPSGAGKTTLAHLLARFYDVNGGRITIDGVDIRDVTLASLRQQLSVVSQDTFLFNVSVAQNIAYGLPQASMEAVEHAARAAYADEFIRRLPEGYHTVIGERGVTLSGGQRQRLAIARALLRNTPLLILDEATSALDVESERFVQQALDALMVGRTSLVIAHRLSTIRHADKIAVLKDGRIIETGKHAFLLANNSEYARLHELQFANP